MIRKYFKRIFAWGLLITVLTFASIYGRRLVIEPMDQEILELEQKQKNLEFRVLSIKTQINRYTVDYLDNGAINSRIPTGYDQLRMENFYVKKPATIDRVNGNLVNYTITNDSKPANLSLSNDVRGVRVTTTVEFQTEEQIYNYLAELHQSIRAVYVDTINFNLPGEEQENRKEPYKYTVQLTYYTFYYQSAAKK